MSFDFQIVPPIFGYVAKLRISERNAKKTRFISIAEWKYLRPQVKITIKRAENKKISFFCFPERE